MSDAINLYADDVITMIKQIHENQYYNECDCEKVVSTAITAIQELRTISINEIKSQIQNNVTPPATWVESNVRVRSTLDYTGPDGRVHSINTQGGMYELFKALIELEKHWNKTYA